MTFQRIKKACIKENVKIDWGLCVFGFERWITKTSIFHIKKGKNAAQICWKICTWWRCKNACTRNDLWDFDLKNFLSKAEIDSDKVKILIDTNVRYMEIAVLKYRNWTQRSMKKWFQNWWKSQVLSSITTPDHTHFCKYSKNYWNWVGVVSHLWYSSDLAPSNYHLFRSLQNFFE